MKKFIEYRLDKVRNVRLGMNALNRIKNKLGKSINKIDLANDFDTYEISVILWAGMVHEDQELTPEKVMDLIDEYSDIKTLMKVLGEAMEEFFGTPKGQGTAE